MLVSLKWLDSMVKVPDTLQDFCDRLDLTGNRASRAPRRWVPTSTV